MYGRGSGPYNPEMYVSTHSIKLSPSAEVHISSLMNRAKITSSELTKLDAKWGKFNGITARSINLSRQFKVFVKKIHRKTPCDGLMIMTGCVFCEEMQCAICCIPLSPQGQITFCYYVQTSYRVGTNTGSLQQLLLLLLWEC